MLNAYSVDKYVFYMCLETEIQLLIAVLKKIKII